MRREWVSDFWKQSGLASFKAGSDNTEPLYFDDAAAVLTVEEAAALKKIVAALTGNGYSQVLYDEMAMAVSAGYISGGEIIKDAADISTGFDVVPAETLQAIKDKADAFAFMVNQREQQTLYGLIDNAIANGQTVGSLTDSIKGAFSDGYHVIADDGTLERTIPTDAWSKMVARTELNRAQTFGQMAVYQSAGIQKVTWMTNHGGTVCDACEEADGEVATMGDMFDGVDRDMPPAHPNCAPPGTLVATSRGALPIEDIVVGDLVVTHRNRLQKVLALSRTVVSEDLVELRVGSNVLRVTGNHPIYTGNRWTPAAALKVGDKIACVNTKAVSGPSGKSDDVPAVSCKPLLLDDVLAEFASGPMPTSAVYFDREHPIGERNVDAEPAICEVDHMLNAGYVESLRNDSLVDGFADVLPGDRAPHDFLVAGLATASGGVGGSGDALTVLGSGALEPQGVGLGRTAVREPHDVPTPVKRGASDTGLDGQLQDGLAGNVAVMELTEHGFGVGFSESRHIAIVPLAHVHRTNYSGTVYNFAVAEDESYIAEGIVVHNCCCALLPADEDVVSPYVQQRIDDKLAA